MRKRARRLWLGDWQRDQEPGASQPPAADGADTVVVTSENDGDERPRSNQPRIAIVLGLALACIAAFALFSGGNDKPVSSARSQTAPAQVPPTAQAQPQTPQVPQGVPPQGFGGADLTGPAATKAAEAALAQFPGDIERVTAGPTGDGYVVHVIQPDGNEVHVLVDGGFKVQGSDAGSAPPSLGPGTSQ